MRHYIFFKTLLRFKFVSLFRFFLYKLQMLMGLNRLRKNDSLDKFDLKFFDCSRKNSQFDFYETYDFSPDLGRKLLIFGHIPLEINGPPPLWHIGIHSGFELSSVGTASHSISDFAIPGVDIKEFWEISRMSWASRMACMIRFDNHSNSVCSGIENLNTWLADWVKQNPSYFGVNWRCGQEASVRIINLILTAFILYEPFESRSIKPDLLKLIEIHIIKVRKTFRYSIAQDNNHGILESAALFLGGYFLHLCGIKNMATLGHLGKARLEERVDTLTDEGGTFSQYSVNYHRFFLDTLSLVEILRNWLGLQAFSPTFNRKAGAITDWLGSFVISGNGLTPNIGANDGAYLLNFIFDDYCDYSPSWILGSMVFRNRVPTTEPKFDNHAKVIRSIFRLNRGEVEPTEKAESVFYDAGFVKLHLNNYSVSVFVRFPSFDFRPSQNDLLHVDLWVKGENLLRDAGSYSYNCEEPWQSYFTSSAAHNTIQFDGRDQMPRLSRFLLGAWPKARDVLFDAPKEGTTKKFSCRYKDYLGATHHRSVTLKEHSLKIVDTVSDFNKVAVARFRLNPEREWQISGEQVSDGQHTLKFEANSSIETIKLVEGWESRYYFQKSKVPVVEITLTEACKLTTEYCWS